MYLLIPKNAVLLSPGRDFGRVDLLPQCVELGGCQGGVALDVGYDLDAVFLGGFGHNFF
jgi:hypothetical protein